MFSRMRKEKKKRFFATVPRGAKLFNHWKNTVSNSGGGLGEVGENCYETTDLCVCGPLYVSNHIQL